MEIKIMKKLALLSLLTLFAGTGALAQQPQATPPPPQAPRTVQLPKPVEKTLANGLRVIVVQRAEMPLVSAQLLVRSGGEVDPTEMAGVDPEYVALVDPDSFELVHNVNGRVLVAVAARIGDTRLIDNTVIHTAATPDGAPTT